MDSPVSEDEARVAGLEHVLGQQGAGPPVRRHVVEADLDYTQSYTTEFVCKGVGKDLKM